MISELEEPKKTEVIPHYKGPVYTVIFKYSFIFGLVNAFPGQHLYGVSVEVNSIHTRQG